MKKDRIAELLTRQVKEPVRFYESIALMKEAGVRDLSKSAQEKSCQVLLKKLIEPLT